MIHVEIPSHTVAAGVCRPYCYGKLSERKLHRGTSSPLQSVCIYNNYCLQPDCSSQFIFFWVIFWLFLHISPPAEEKAQSHSITYRLTQPEWMGLFAATFKYNACICFYIYVLYCAVLTYFSLRTENVTALNTEYFTAQTSYAFTHWWTEGGSGEQSILLVPPCSKKHNFVPLGCPYGK